MRHLHSSLSNKSHEAKPHAKRRLSSDAVFIFTLCPCTGGPQLEAVHQSLGMLGARVDDDVQVGGGGRGAACSGLGAFVVEPGEHVDGNAERSARAGTGRDARGRAPSRFLLVLVVLMLRRGGGCHRGRTPAPQPLRALAGRAALRGRVRRTLLPKASGALEVVRGEGEVPLQGPAAHVLVPLCEHVVDVRQSSASMLVSTRSR